MREKALENLTASESLLERDPPLANAAASRAYYAAYHACWHALERQGYEVPVRNGSRYWPHDTFATEIFRLGLVDEDQSEEMAELYAKRVLADYFEDQIPARAAVELAASARAIILRCLGDV